MQYGGWYNNPATGRNQRWFNGVWTDGAEPSGGNPNDPATKYNAVVDNYTKEIEKATQDLIGQANGNYDFAAKWIKAQFQQALGNDDTARAEMLKKVASSLEEKVGTLGFDYETGTYRANQDLSRLKDRTNSNRDLALKRLDEDLGVANKQLTSQVKQERSQLEGNLNQRGILGGESLDKAQGLAGNVVGDFNENTSDRFSALQRAFDRGQMDTNISADNTIEDATLSTNRSLEDLGTNLRRGANSATQQRDYGLESAQRAKQAAIDAANREKALSIKSVKLTAGQNI